MGIDYNKDSELLKAIAHPVRLKIVKGLMGDECSVKKMVKVLKLPQSTVSQHLGILRSRGVITPSKEGVKTCYSVIDERVKDIVGIFKK
ncbi:MAG: metalloregulator ArsR/SmtB family transcription factor [Candidatus Omnitrophota bacterium]|nr:metalloregulator ArsR/SmtB family transcription factor [Candidatus Omnitrophota bacterium]